MSKFYLVLLLITFIIMMIMGEEIIFFTVDNQTTIVFSDVAIYVLSVTIGLLATDVAIDKLTQVYRSLKRNNNNEQGKFVDVSLLYK